MQQENGGTLRDWLRWFGRWEQRDRARSRLTSLREAYGAHGERVIQLSNRMDRARHAAGSTRRSLEFVERAFIDATGEYARIGELLQQLESQLAGGTIGDFAGAESALRGLGPKLDELERQLAAWEQTWQQVPSQVEDVAQSLAALRSQAEAAAAQAGVSLPVSQAIATMEQHLERIRRTLAEGNPIEAGHLVEDLRIAMAKVSEQVGLYASAAGAIVQAEAETAALKARLGPDSPGEAVAALAAAEAFLSRLRPALTAGNLEQLQHDLLGLQRSLAAVRTALR
jgi:DNA repair exonuclease SbcCD ATPase subunit